MEELSIDDMRAEVNEHGVLDIDQAEELLDRLEQAERNADTYQTLYEQRAETLEQAERDLAIVRESQKNLAKQLVATRTEQGKAEWKVTRVRYLSRYLKNLAPGDKHYAGMIDLALDGDTRRLADQGLGDNLARTTKNGDNNE